MDDPFAGLEDLFDQYAKKSEPITKSACIDCGCELSVVMDAYYGRDEQQGKRCSGCRRKE